jgi:4-amino-4-deoxy-L-arabinose transferase-like glycosyltransferase
VPRLAEPIDQSMFDGVRQPAGDDRRPAAARARGLVEHRWLPVVALTLLALGLRLATMRDSLMGDELFLYSYVHDHTLGYALHLVRVREKTPPLIFIADWATSRIGDPTYWVRLPSLLAGVALVPLGYRLGERVFGRWAGLLAATLVTLSPFAIFYAVEDRAYAPVACFAALSTVLLLEALDRRRWWWWLGYGLAVLATIYSHYVGLFVVLVQAAWAFGSRRDQLRTLVVVHAAIVICWLPWLPSFLLQERHSAAEGHRVASLVPSTLPDFGRINGQVLFGFPFARLADIPGLPELFVAIAVVVIAAIATVARCVRRRHWPGLGSEPVLICLLALAAPVGVALVSLRPDQSFMLARNLSSSYVAAMVLFGGLVTRMRRGPALVGAVALVAVMAIGAVSAEQAGYRRTPYRLAARWIDDRSPVSDPVILESFLSLQPPLNSVLSINLGEPRVVATTPAGTSRAWAHARHGGHVFVVVDLLGPYKSATTSARRAGPGHAFLRVAQHRWVGLDDLLAAEYRYAPAR